MNTKHLQVRGYGVPRSCGSLTKPTTSPIIIRHEPTAAPLCPAQYVRGGSIARSSPALQSKHSSISRDLHAVTKECNSINSTEVSRTSGYQYISL